jgi:peptidoglycan/LPS O-acetylase OafA/YrhL
MKYRPEIDGLRSIAVLSVIFYHAGFSAFEGGYVGVDIFFVISGYLITNIVCAELICNKFSFLRFYERRFRRIAPALLVVLFFSSIAAWTTLGSDSIREFSRSLLSSVFFVSNVYFYLTTGYFSAASENIPLLHTWSLSVEEQYYIFAPFLLSFFVRRGLLFSTIAISIFVVVGLMLTTFVGVNYREAAFFLLPFRAWELMVGAVVALWQLRDASEMKFESRVSSFLAMLGMLMIFFSVLAYDETYYFPGVAATLPIGGTVLIISFANQKSGVGFFLSRRPFVFVGLLSYSAYLWHQPLFAIYRLNNGDFDIFVGVVLVVVVFALSLFSWRYFEQPARDKNRVSINRLIRIASICVLAVCLLAVAGGYSSDARRVWVEFRMGGDRSQREALVNSHSDYDLYDFMASPAECIFWKKSVDSDFERKYSECAKKFGPGVVVLGGSHAMNLYNVIAKSRY